MPKAILLAGEEAFKKTEKKGLNANFVEAQQALEKNEKKGSNANFMDAKEALEKTEKVVIKMVKGSIERAIDTGSSECFVTFLPETVQDELNQLGYTVYEKCGRIVISWS